MKQLIFLVTIGTLIGLAGTLKIKPVDNAATAKKILAKNLDTNESDLVLEYMDCNKRWHESVKKYHPDVHHDFNIQWYKISTDEFGDMCGTFDNPEIGQG